MSDEELQEEIAEIIYGVGDVAVDTHMPDVEAVMELIARDRIKTRIDELENLPKVKLDEPHSHKSARYREYGKFVALKIEKRIAELQGSDTRSGESKKCCKYHDNMEFDETDLTECGMAGMGKPTVCCRACPDNIYPDNAAHYYIEEEGLET